VPNVERLHAEMTELLFGTTADTLRAREVQADREGGA
jgi:hypothetical protein